MNLDGAPLLGDPSAKWGMVIFSDFQCPYCRAFATGVFPKIVDTYVKTGRLRVAFRQFPLQNIHPFATTAASIAACTVPSGRFWQFHDALFAKASPSLGKDTAGDLAQEMNLGGPGLQACVKGEGEARVQGDLALGKALGISGTPAFFIGDLTGGALAAKKVLIGALPYDDFAAAIEHH